MAFPVCVSAQDDDVEEEEIITSRVVKKTQKKYDTRVVRGQVKSAVTGQPVSGALVFADGVEGYSVLTEDDGTYQLNVPLFTTAIYSIRLPLQPTTVSRLIRAMTVLLLISSLPTVLISRTRSSSSWAVRSIASTVTVLPVSVR